jgi:hypothetical protein
LRSFRSRLNFANVVSALALFLAVGGGSAIALQGTNTVDSGDLQPGSVHTSDLADSAVTGGKTKDESIAARDVNHLGVRRVTVAPGNDPVLLTNGTLTLNGNCALQGGNGPLEAKVRLTTTQDGSWVTYYSGAAMSGESEVEFDSAAPHTLRATAGTSNANPFGTGTWFTAVAPDGQTLAGLVINAGSIQADRCTFAVIGLN